MIKYDGVNWQIFNISNSPIPANWFKQGISDSKNNVIYNLSSFYPPYQNYGLIFYNEDSVIVTSLENYPTLINSFYLFQNNPNPFNSFTRIQYFIPKSDKVQIKVYDILGNELQTLINEYKHAGIYEVNFDANNLPSGVYFYRLTTGAFTDTKKLVLLK